MQNAWTSFDQSFEVIDHFINLFSFSNLHFFIWFNIFDHFVSISEGDFKFAEILSKSDILDLGIFLSIIFNFSNSDDGIVKSVVTSIDDLNGHSNGSIQ